MRWPCRLAILTILVLGWSVRSPAQSSALDLVLRLGDFRAELPHVPSTGIWPEEELRRQDVYARLRLMHEAVLPALAEGLAHEDVRVRRGAALYLNVAGSSWGRLAEIPLDIRATLPALITALSDSDTRVQALAAQAIGIIGSEGAEATPTLAGLLGAEDEGVRNSALIALAHIGPAARQALPAVREALGAPEEDVRRFAERAIEKIEARP